MNDYQRGLLRAAEICESSAQPDCDCKGCYYLRVATDEIRAEAEKAAESAPEAEPVAWMLRKKSSGFVRGLTASAPSDETLQIAEIDGDEWVPLYSAPSASDETLISIDPNKPVELLFTENDIYVDTDVKHPTLPGKVALVVRKEQSLEIKNALQKSEPADEALIEEVAEEGNRYWYQQRGVNVPDAIGWGIREYLKRREGK
jgi:hypothetical protein